MSDVTCHECKMRCVLSAVAAFAIGSILMTCVVARLAEDVHQAEAIKHGAAEYNKTTGQFQWITKEGE